MRVFRFATLGAVVLTSLAPAREARLPTATPAPHAATPPAFAGLGPEQHTLRSALAVSFEAGLAARAREPEPARDALALDLAVPVAAATVALPEPGAGWGAAPAAVLAMAAAWRRRRR